MGGQSGDESSCSFLSSLWTLTARFAEEQKNPLLKKLFRSLITLFSSQVPNFCPASSSSIVSFSVTPVYPPSYLLLSLCPPREGKTTWILGTKQTTTWGRRKSAVTPAEGGQMVEDLCRQKKKNSSFLSHSQKKLLLTLGWIIRYLCSLRMFFKKIRSPMYVCIYIHICVCFFLLREK